MTSVQRRKTQIMYTKRGEFESSSLWFDLAFLLRKKVVVVVERI